MITYNHRDKRQKTKEQRQKKFSSAQHGQTRSKTDSSLPSLGKLKVKRILLCPSWASKKQNWFFHSRLGQARSETNSPLPSLGKQEVKQNLPFPSWANLMNFTYDHTAPIKTYFTQQNKEILKSKNRPQTYSRLKLFKSWKQKKQPCNSLKVHYVTA